MFEYIAPSIRIHLLYFFLGHNSCIKRSSTRKTWTVYFNFCGRSAVARFFLYYEWFRCNCWDIKERQEKSIFNSHLKLSVGEWISIITRDLDEIWVFMDPLFNFCGSQCSLKQLIRSHYGWHKLPDADKNGNTLKCKYNTVIEWKWCECMPMYLMNPHII